MLRTSWHAAGLLGMSDMPGSTASSSAVSTCAHTALHESWVRVCVPCHDLSREPGDTHLRAHGPLLGRQCRRKRARRRQTRRQTRRLQVRRERAAHKHEEADVLLRSATTRMLVSSGGYTNHR